MSTTILPRNDNARLVFLKRAAETAEQDYAIGNQYLEQATVTEIKAMLADYMDRLFVVQQKLSVHIKVVREKNEAINRLMLYVRDFWQGLKRRVKRCGEPKEVLTYYHLTSNGANPRPASETEWLDLSRGVIAGDAIAIAAGYPAMSNPSAAEVNTVLQIAQAEYDQIAMADRELDQAQEHLAEIRGTAEALIKEVIVELRYHLRKFDKPSQRRIMQTYGVVFKKPVNVAVLD